jgi:hypothetical protein
MRLRPKTCSARINRQTVRRAASCGDVLVIHDTTQLTFSGSSPREGLGRLPGTRSGQGCLLHVSLLLADDSFRTPLGALHFETGTRSEPRGTKERQYKELNEDPFHEGRRWRQGVDECQAALGEPPCIHVMDREGDSFELMAALLEHNWRFVIRMCSARSTTTRIEGTRQHVGVRSSLEDAEFVFSRTVSLSRRVERWPHPRTRPAREQRETELHVRARSVQVLRLRSAPAETPPSLTVHVVQVVETTPPDGLEPVEWTLLTNLPISSNDEIARVVNVHRARWVIEEFFKALKTGRILDKRQNESLHALRNIIAILLPIAWRMLVLRTLASAQPDALATSAITPRMLAVLVALAKVPMPAAPTVADAMWAIASLGGHQHRRTRPGWQVLGRGFEKLLFAEVVWVAARAGPNCDRT